MKKDIIITDELIDDILESVYHDGNKDLMVDKELLKHLGYQVEEKKSALEEARLYDVECKNSEYYAYNVKVCDKIFVENKINLYEKAITELQEEIDRLKNCGNCKHTNEYFCVRPDKNINCTDYSKWEPKE